VCVGIALTVYIVSRNGTPSGPTTYPVPATAGAATGVGAASMPTGIGPATR
jgi:hypothetical protein